MKSVRIETELTIEGIRYRKVRRIKTDLKGYDLKIFKMNERAKMRDEIRREAGDPSQLYLMNYQEFFMYYLNSKKREQNTIDWYMDYSVRLFDYFGRKKIKNISKTNCEDFFDELKNEVSEATGKPLSAKTIKHYKTVHNAVMNYAVKKKVIAENPSIDIITPTVTRNVNGKFLTPDEIKMTVDLFYRHAPYKWFVALVLSYIHALRPGEMQGLKWKKIQGDNIIIDEALASTSIGYILKSTKTEDKRTEKLSDYEIAILDIHKQNEIKKHGEKGIENRFVFTNSYGNHVGSASFRNYYREFCKKHGLKYVTPYGLRHTTATILALNNIPLINISNKLRHRNVRTTEIYTHAVDSVNDLMNNTLIGTISGGEIGGES